MTNISSQSNIEPKSIWACNIPTTLTLKARSKVILPHIWSPRGNGKGLTPSKDIEIILTEDQSIKAALINAEKAAYEHVRNHGAHFLRQYYIEGVQQVENELIFILGT